MDNQDITFGLREQTAPDWMRPGVEVLQEGRGERGVWMKIVTVDGSIVSLAHPELGGIVERGIVGFVAQLPHREPVAA